MRKHRSRQRTGGRAAVRSFDNREWPFAGRNHPHSSSTRHPELVSGSPKASAQSRGVLKRVQDDDSGVIMRPCATPQKTAFLHHPVHGLIRPMTKSRPDPRSRAVQNRRISRVPAFTPVPLRARSGTGVKAGTRDIRRFCTARLRGSGRDLVMGRIKP